MEEMKKNSLNNEL